MHLARIKRHGHFGLKTGFHKSEKLPHPIVDDYIRENCNKLIDTDIVSGLKKMGFSKANQWLVRYRRRRLGIKKYLYGETKKHLNLNSRKNIFDLQRKLIELQKSL